MDKMQLSNLIKIVKWVSSVLKLSCDDLHNIARSWWCKRREEFSIMGVGLAVLHLISGRNWVQCYIGQVLSVQCHGWRRSAVLSVAKDAPPPDKPGWSQPAQNVNTLHRFVLCPLFNQSLIRPLPCKTLEPSSCKDQSYSLYGLWWNPRPGVHVVFEILHI